MKKLLALITVVILCFCFVSCTGVKKEQKPNISSAVTESETSSIATEDSVATSSEPSSSKSNSTSSKKNSTSNKNTTTSSNNVTTSSKSESNTTSKNTPSRTATSGTSSIKIPIELWPGFKNNSGVKEEDKVTPFTSSQEITSSGVSSYSLVNTDVDSKISPLLFSLTHENGATAYLFGSIHVGTSDMYPLPGYVYKAFNESDYLAVECDITDVDEENANLALQLLRYKNGEKIRKDNVYIAARKILVDNNIYTTELDYYMPVLWSSLIDGLTEEKSQLKSEYGVDLHLINTAKNCNKQVLEIESVLGQYQILSTLYKDVQDMLLYSSVVTYNSEDPDASSRELLDIWCKGNYEELKKMVNTDTTDLSHHEAFLIQEYNTAMLTNRDKHMTRFIDARLREEKNVFICVGAAHVVGEGGIIDQLKDLGYTVTQITE